MRLRCVLLVLIQGPVAAAIKSMWRRSHPCPARAVSPPPQPRTLQFAQQLPRTWAVVLIEQAVMMVEAGGGRPSGVCRGRVVDEIAVICIKILTVVFVPGPVPRQLSLLIDEP